MQQLEQSGSESSNITEGMSEAIETLMVTNQGKKFNRVMVMFTDGETPLGSKTDVGAVRKGLVDNGILLYVIILCDQSRDDLVSSVSENIEQYQELAKR